MKLLPWLHGANGVRTGTPNVAQAAAMELKESPGPTFQSGRALRGSAGAAGGGLVARDECASRALRRGESKDLGLNRLESPFRVQYAL
eukprot:CAMPEP_0204501512 /NCGR_PEP_ID=MMETSP0471-20130131/99366_1 /ASSEMBLY_ACC=CAM_ASM_000602 /TAXON_ID=2969 /ORGANISM="Oxyrrhis marina" /LENGTH=87 /DNA_ID=CAMNT_0051506191 /DNA_START=174 /DNA_END=438 /DNA_ORIENTATION=-